MTLIESAKMSGLDPQAYLADVLDRIHDHMSNRLDELLPWNWAPKAQIIPPKFDKISRNRRDFGVCSV